MCAVVTFAPNSTGAFVLPLTQSGAGAASRCSPSCSRRCACPCCAFHSVDGTVPLLPGASFANRY